MKTLSYFIFSIAAIAQLTAGTIQVPSQYATIQSAVNASSNGDTVLVAPGTYTENITLNGKRIVLASHFILNEDRSYITGTVIKGDQPVHTDTASVIRIVHGEDSSTVITGFTITGGSGSIWEDPLNPGYKWRGGGGVIILNASPSIRHNIIRHNNVSNTTGVDGAQGGGILCYGGNPEISNNLIMLNHSNYGGGLVVDYSGALIRNNIIYRNTGGTAWYGGSAIWCIGNPAVPKPKIIDNNTIVSNTASTGTGGVLIWNTTATLRNNILWGNSIIQIKTVSGSVSAAYNCIQGGYAGAGNINLNPVFSDSNFYLNALSACIDAGDTSVMFNDPENPVVPGNAAWPSLGALRNDIGVYGGPKSKLLPAVNDTWVSLSATSLNFGSVSLSDSATGKITLTDKGCFPVQIDSIRIKHGNPDIMIYTTFPFSLPAFQTDTLRLQWRPTTLNPLTDTLLLFHNDTSSANPLYVKLSGTVTVVYISPDPIIPVNTVLDQNYPNPFNPVTTIRYSLAKAGIVKLAVYNVLGQPVKTLINQYETAGTKTITWNGTNQKAKSVSSGIYLYRLAINGVIYTRKMILLR